MIGLTLLIAGVVLFLVLRSLTSSTFMQHRTASLFGDNLFVNVDYPDGWMFTGARDRFRLYNPNTAGIDSFDLPLTRVDVELIDHDAQQPLDELARVYTSDLIDTEDTDGLPSDTILINDPEILPMGNSRAISVSGRRTSGEINLEFLAIYRSFPENRKVVVVYAQAPAGSMETHSADTRRLAESIHLEIMHNTVNPTPIPELTMEVTPEVTAEIRFETTPEVTPEVTLEITPELSPTGSPTESDTTTATAAATTTATSSTEATPEPAATP